jgi:hypothetical protein
MTLVIMTEEDYESFQDPEVIRVGTACYRWLGFAHREETTVTVDEKREDCDCPCNACCEKLTNDLMVTVDEVTACNFVACGPDEDANLLVPWVDDCEWEDDWIEGPDCFYWVRVYLDCDPPGKWKMDISLFGGECGCSEENGNPLELLKGTSPVGPWPDGHCGQGGLAVSFEGITVAEVPP